MSNCVRGNNKKGRSKKGRERGGKRQEKGKGGEEGREVSLNFP